MPHISTIGLYIACKMIRMKRKKCTRRQRWIDNKINEDMISSTELKLDNGDHSYPYEGDIFVPIDTKMDGVKNR